MTPGQAIIAQLGGQPFLTMTGAKKILELSTGGVQFDLPRGIAYNGINKVRIEVAGNDTYKVSFLKYNRLNLTYLAVFEDVYADALPRIFRENTGLRVSLTTLA